jgi:hypothetical protein
VNREDVQLRRFIASQYDLDWSATNLLQGSSVEELDASARALKRLIDERQEQPPTDIITTARIAKLERKRELQDIITGRARQRDRYGRFLASSSDGGSFDGGARLSAPAEPETHEHLLTRVLISREADVGRAL